jgi:hypothetical protein
MLKGGTPPGTFSNRPLHRNAAGNETRINFAGTDVSVELFDAQIIQLDTCQNHLRGWVTRLSRHLAE